MPLTSSPAGDLTDDGRIDEPAPMTRMTNDDAAFETRHGTVTSYESARGLGTLSARGSGASDQRYAFHCTAIADGSREIAEGAHVSFRVGAVGPGTWEAIDVRPVESP